MTQTALGIAVLLLGGFLQGIFSSLLPCSPWSHEAKWLVFAVLAYAALPWALAAYSVPTLGDVWQHVDASVLGEVGGFGLAWGVGSVLFGLGLDALGNSLAFALILGLCAVVGSILPLVVFHPADVATSQGQCLWAALGITLVGLGLCSKAGVIKEKELAGKDAASRGEGDSRLQSLLVAAEDKEASPQEPTQPPHSGSSSFARGLVICLASGVFSACQNLSVASGKPLEDAAQTFGGATKTLATNVVLALCVSLGALPNVALMTWTLWRNGTWRELSPWTGRHHLRSLVVCLTMAVVWFAGFVLYGIGAEMLGSLGNVVGWPIYINTMVITGNCAGVAQGDWRGTSSRARAFMAAGVFLLVCSIALVGFSNAKAK